MVQGLLHQLVQRLMCCPYSPVPCLPFCRVLEQQEPAASSEQLLGLLGTLLSTHDALLALNQRDLRRTLALLSQLAAQVAAAWRRTSSGSPDELLAAHPAAPKEVLAVLTAPADAAGGAAGATPAPGLPSEQAASIAGLLERQHGLLEELSDAADVLRFWGRRSEKAAAGAATAEGREGDVPPMLTQVGMGRVASSAVKAGCHGLRTFAASPQLYLFLLHEFLPPFSLPISHVCPCRRSSCCGLPARPTKRSRRLQTCAHASWCVSATSPPTFRRSRLAAGGSWRVQGDCKQGLVLRK